MRRRICAGNWKMHKTAGESTAFFDAFLPLVPGLPQEVEIVVCPPFTALEAASAQVRGNARVALGAQNVHWAASGAFTGEISAPMLLEFGVRYAIAGHSERRQYFGESDESVRLRTAAALAAGLTPILAVGETAEIRSAGDAERHVIAQVRAALDGLSRELIARLIVAYEPIWAIGTGQNCDPADADVMARAIRSCADVLDGVPVLYGGSVKPENIAEYCAMPQIDGALVGGASLDPQSFAALVKGAAAR